MGFSKETEVVYLNILPICHYIVLLCPTSNQYCGLRIGRSLCFYYIWRRMSRYASRNTNLLWLYFPICFNLLCQNKVDVYTSLYACVALVATKSGQLKACLFCKVHTHSVSLCLISLVVGPTTSLCYCIQRYKIWWKFDNDNNSNKLQSYLDPCCTIYSVGVGRLRETCIALQK